MSYKRLLSISIEENLARGKSILLLGPRQTGKTTLIETIAHDHYLNFLDLALRRRYEKYPEQFEKDIRGMRAKAGRSILVVDDEIQKLPILLDSIQLLIDKKVAQFILTGSSARKLRQQGANLLPGRIVLMRLDPLVYLEYEKDQQELSSLLLYGSLPGILSAPTDALRMLDLTSYINTYLEEEIRQEAQVRSLGAFTRFLELAAYSAGQNVNFSNLSREVGVSHTTIKGYYEILEDSLIVERIDPYIKGRRPKLMRSSKYLFFDMGVQHFSASGALNLSPTQQGFYFEHFVGLELIRLIRLFSATTKLYFWKDANGSVEIDYLLLQGQNLVPIEVKFSEAPTESDARHLKTFLKEYPDAKKAYIVCNTPFPYTLGHQIQVIHWQQLKGLL